VKKRAETSPNSETGDDAHQGLFPTGNTGDSGQDGEEKRENKTELSTLTGRKEGSLRLVTY